jgi:DNA-directed RNA polymerase subunit RPC12/RpoP
MVELKCKRCGREWDYKGQKEYYCSCPDCRTSVKIKEFDEK